LQQVYPAFPGDSNMLASTWDLGFLPAFQPGAGAASFLFIRMGVGETCYGAAVSSLIDFRCRVMHEVKRPA